MTIVRRQGALGQVTFVASLGDLGADVDVRGIQRAQVHGTPATGWPSVTVTPSWGTTSSPSPPGQSMKTPLRAGDLGDPVAFTEVDHDVLTTRDPGVVEADGCRPVRARWGQNPAGRGSPVSGPARPCGSCPSARIVSGRTAPACASGTSMDAHRHIITVAMLHVVWLVI